MRVHQILFNFTNKKLPNEIAIKKAIHSIRSGIPESWKYTLWDLPTAIKFVSQEYPYFSGIFEMVHQHPIVLCDFFRYLLMYHYGGIYLDLDFVNIQLSDFFTDLYEKKVLYTPMVTLPDVILSEEWENSSDTTNTLHNGVLISRTCKHPFWMDLLILIVNKIVVKGETPRTHNEVYETTGPKLLCSVMKQRISIYTNVVILPYPYFCPYIAENSTEQVVCNGDNKAPSTQTHCWVFPKHEMATKKHFPISYAVCVSQGGSMWKH
jgi:mannosyltransferase OCH1-like enzyme